jgi:hypothetical protein
MALISDITTVTYSGYAHIDALLDSGPGWNWLLPTRQELFSTSSIASGNETDNTDLIGSITAFNAAQQDVCLDQLANISQLTGITFTATSTGTAADLHFAAVNISNPQVTTTGRYVVGTSAANVITGPSGNDKFEGLAGNDTFIADGQSDIVFENVGEGVDTLISSASFYLYNNLGRQKEWLHV